LNFSWIVVDCRYE